MPTHTEQVTAFFNQLASDYGRRYTQRYPYLAFHFRERMRWVLDTLAVDQRALLDVGCGTGALYDEIVRRGLTVDYYGLDPARAMLDAGHIPPERRRACRLEEAALAPASVDVIIGLGLTTYQSREELRQWLREAARVLRGGGQLALSFTHAGSLEVRWRRRLKNLWRRRSKSSTVLTAPFPTQAYRPEDLADLLPSHLHQRQLYWLPASIPFLHHFFPRFSVYLSRHWLTKASARWRTDFIVIFEKG